MLAWVSQNIANIIIGAVILAVILLIIVSMLRKKKQGKTSCGCGCNDCGMSEICHDKK
jgi:hypothetical protein